MNAPCPAHLLSADEQRDAEIASLTITHADRIRSLVASGEPITLAGIADAWTSTLESNEVAALIVRTAIADPSSLPSLVRFQIEQAIQDAAECAAILDVERMEADRKESEDEARVDHAEWERSLRGSGLVLFAGSACYE